LTLPLLLHLNSNLMKKFAFLFGLFFSLSLTSQKTIDISFVNEYADVYHLALIIYTPDGKCETRVSDVKPFGTKKYSYPANTEIYIADYTQEAIAMKGIDLKASGLKPYIVLDAKEEQVTILLSTVNKQ
jgi:hypothetical protein